MSVRLVILSLFLCLHLPTAGRAELRVQPTESFYDVFGTTVDELLRDLRFRGPRDDKRASQHWAFTRWRISWKARYAQSAEGCRIGSVVTSLSLNYLYPRWQQQRYGTPRARRAWRRMMGLLRKHELRHGQISYEGAKEFDDAVTRLQPRPTCEEMGDAASRFANSIFDEIKARNRRYDRDTKHGQREGIGLRRSR